ncbi:MAG: diaminopimelate epimerase [Massilibacteroides sp.]|nr:diaminopimelate epimerase [Massilibacteroides sp.]MDD3061382.1 diaminopimelate epimerase [Massilibacteroides sp.]MDD4115134.1 diaminopimelate epimerase [Massilibacteroides sp.]MDD4659473.1 diaminopimelate epimerase [Massilibacteroides sp.]
MTKLIEFTKMHGAGNDYIYVNTSLYPLDHPEDLAIKWSAPHIGIGADGLVLIDKSKVADFSMRIFNADGSEAMMCGNASRCIGKYVYENGLTQEKNITLETLSGIKELELKVQGNHVTEVTVDMGEPVIEKENLTLTINDKEYTGIVISMGNPHFVIFVDDIDKVDVKRTGPLLEKHPFFPNRTNVEFVQVYSPDQVRMRVWERGSGITLACGTGACATAVAGCITGKTGDRLNVLMDGGGLNIRWDKAYTNKIYMTGGAVRVFEGSIEI